MRIAIIGGGSWGSALAMHLAKRANNSIKMWEFFPEQAKQMQETRICPLLPHVPLPKKISVSSDMSEVLLNAEVVFLVVPSNKVESTMEKARQFLNDQPIIICSKGFAAEGKLLSTIVEDKVKGSIFCLYGPTHAEEVCKSMFTGIVLAGGKEKKELQELIQDDDLKVDLSDDIIGMQLAAALKNILAVFVGILDGLSLGDNAKAYVMTKGLEEIEMIGQAMGAKRETFHGLAGMGDVIVTCTSKHSRNRHVGEQIGKGKKLDEILKEMKMVAEGVTAAEYIKPLAKKYKLKLPLLVGLSDILFAGKDPKNVLKEL